MFRQAIEWTNNNQGLVSLLLFVATIFFGWLSGIFSSLRRKPNFKFTVIPGPTFCTTFLTGEKEGPYDVHRTAIALYLHISNVGSAPSSIDNIALGYHWHCAPFTPPWWQFGIRWFWISDQTVTLEDFQYHFADKVKVYPSLFQGSAILGSAPETYLQVGQTVNGVVYFEQRESWGACYPLQRNGRTRIRVAITDAFGKRHQRTVSIPVISLEEARKYNPAVGQSLPAVRRVPTPQPQHNDPGA